ncbi:pleckstrin homology domain-containing family F member 2-like [Betta splendens]|uniref:Pleckstrin homology domain-containing family F member 2-like n=1 Tax=Betta splendens TaxID=158456 RepID=A0A6P7N5L5_BETSP|nr:pleckstrin homology domain-containing family F member 2-like [Betta splendens]
MYDQLTFERENRERIQAVENSFRPSGRPLTRPGRFLMGEGCLLKQGRRRPEPRTFFLFNDMLMYGTKVLRGRWYKKQNIIPLEDVLLGDVEDSDELKNQWLIRTPRKSFFVSAESLEEKRAWMQHIEQCKADLLQSGGLQAGANFAVSWIPDQTSYKCMRCLKKFSVSRRRHHCRRCGFLVCNNCSRPRELIEHIHPTKRVRVCSLCHIRKEDSNPRLRGDSTGTNSSEDEDSAESSDEEEEEEEATMQDHVPSSWLDFRMGTWGHRTSFQPGDLNLRPVSSPT